LFTGGGVPANDAVSNVALAHAPDAVFVAAMRSFSRRGRVAGGVPITIFGA